MRVLTIFCLLCFPAIAFAQADSDIAAAKASRDIHELILLFLQRGDVQLAEGNYVAAEHTYLTACAYTDTLLDEATAIRIPKMERAYHRYIHSYEKLANVYAVAGNARKAEEAYNRAIRKRDSFYPRLSIHRIPPYVGLGKLFFSQGNNDKAFVYFDMARRKLEKATTSNYNFDKLASEIYQFQFETSLLRGNFDVAWKYLDRFLIALNTTNPPVERIAQALELKARYYLFTGDFPNCEVYLTKAARNLPAASTFSSARVNVTKTKALLLWRKQDIAGAAAVFKELMDGYKSNIRKSFSSMSEVEREQFFVTLKNNFELFNSFILENISSPEANRLLEDMFNMQLYTKALLLNEINKIKLRATESADPELHNLFAEVRKRKEQLAAFYYNGDKKNEAPAIEQEIGNLERQINLKLASMEPDDSEVDWKKIRSHLGNEEAAVEIIRVRKYGPRPGTQKDGSTVYDFTGSVSYVILAVNASSERPDGFVITNGYDLENRYIRYYRNAIKSKVRDTVSYAKFWRPIRQKLSRFNRIYISADGVYNQINLNSLYNPENNKYVLDENDIVLVTNTKDIIEKTSATSVKEARLFGRPAYSHEGSEEKGAARPETGATRSLFDKELSEFTSQDFSDLPGTQGEIRNVSDILRTYGWTVSAHLGVDASETNLKSSKSPGILHIATHGFFLAGEGQSVNSMIRSGILLSGVKNKNRQTYEDGILTAYEATILDLRNTQLVVLSACETGLGEVRNGEGVYGLQRGFKVAGAQNLLMSLWKVDDDATAYLMTEFYKAWSQDNNIHNAFKTAQQMLRRQYHDPYYWASFVLLGN